MYNGFKPECSTHQKDCPYKGWHKALWLSTNFNKRGYTIIPDDLNGLRWDGNGRLLRMLRNERSIPYLPYDGFHYEREF